MAEFNMVNKALKASDVKIAPGKHDSGIKCIVDSYVFGAEASIGDEYQMTKIPEGATILGAHIFAPASLGTTGIFNMGLKAYTNKDGTSVVEDDNSLVQLADGGGQAVLKEQALGSVALHKEIGKGGAEPFLIASEATDAATGLTIYSAVFYSLA
mgnify:CR=1 FL=1|tara:strand:+ start:1048 stop:1512 length:465 start_codon:yes stop_codon:yes gene_type:complete